MILLDGKKTSDQIKEEVAQEVQKIKQAGKRLPHLAVIIVGQNGASKTYVAAKEKACQYVGFESSVIEFPATIEEKTLLDKIDEINKNQAIDGLLVQFPLPKHISETKVTETISPDKDVDGFHPISVGRMSQNLPTFLPATPYGIIELLERYGVETSGKHCVVIGRSNIVGMPMSLLMARKAYPGNATVTICHSQTVDLKSITLQADIVIAALGKPEFLTAEMVKQGAVVIDVGITRVESDKTKTGWKLLGDVKFDEVAPKCSYITPVPGGVGPMTIASLLKNTLRAYYLTQNKFISNV